MPVRIFAAALAATAAVLPAVPASAATHGKVVATYAGLPYQGGELVTYACAGAGVGVTNYWCSVTPVSANVAGPFGDAGAVVVPPPSFTVSVGMSVRSTDGRTYSCAKSVTVTFGTGAPVAGELDCTS